MTDELQKARALLELGEAARRERESSPSRAAHLRWALALQDEAPAILRRYIELEESARVLADVLQVEEAVR